MKCGGLCIVVFSVLAYVLPFCLSLPLCGSSETDQRHCSKAWHHPLSIIHPSVSIFRLWIVCHTAALSVIPQNHTSHPHDLIHWIFVSDFMLCECAWVWYVSASPCVCPLKVSPAVFVSQTGSCPQQTHTILQCSSRMTGPVTLCKVCHTTHTYTLYLTQCQGQCLSSTMCMSVCISDWW